MNHKIILQLLISFLVLYFFFFVKKDNFLDTKYDYNLDLGIYRDIGILKPEQLFDIKNRYKFNNNLNSIEYKNIFHNSFIINKLNKWILKEINYAGSNKINLIKNKINKYQISSDKKFIKYNTYLYLRIDIENIFYIINLQLIYNIVTNEKFIDVFEIKSNPNIEELYFKKYKNRFDLLSTNNLDCSLDFNNNNCSIYLDTVSIDNYKLSNLQNKIENENYCFNNTNNNLNKKQCTNGIWAPKKCIFNEQCPFYKLNRNYKNNRGGCVKGKCEMPLGLTNLTPTKYNPKDLPICHNCIKYNNKCNNKCCYDQLNKKIYNMNSPDFAFENDLIDRLKYKQELLNKKLNVYDIKC